MFRFIFCFALPFRIERFEFVQFGHSSRIQLKFQSRLQVWSTAMKWNLVLEWKAVNLKMCVGGELFVMEKGKLSF